MDDISHLDMSNCCRTSRDSITVMPGYWTLNWEKFHAPIFNIGHVIPPLGKGLYRSSLDTVAHPNKTGPSLTL